MSDLQKLYCYGTDKWYEMVHVLNRVSFRDHKVVVLTLEKSFVPLLPDIFLLPFTLMHTTLCEHACRSFFFGMLVRSSLVLDISKFHNGEAHDIFRWLNKKKFSFLQLSWVWDTDLGQFSGIVCPFLVWKHQYVRCTGKGKKATD